jgi:hypothetical protein
MQHLALIAPHHSHWIPAMLRCVLSIFLAIAVTLPVAADPNRNFTDKALRGEITFQQPPAVLLNGSPTRLAPGARIRGEDNLLKMSGTLVGQRLIVLYTLDMNGQLLDVWVLTARERARSPWPTTTAQAQTWSFDVNAQTWSKP